MSEVALLTQALDEFWRGEEAEAYTSKLDRETLAKLIATIVAYPEWSNQVIGESVGVSNVTARNYRHRLEAAGFVGHTSERIRTDGHVWPADEHMLQLKANDVKRRTKQLPMGFENMQNALVPVSRPELVPEYWVAKLQGYNRTWGRSAIGALNYVARQLFNYPDYRSFPWQRLASEDAAVALLNNLNASGLASPSNYWRWFGPAEQKGVFGLYDVFYQEGLIDHRQLTLIKKLEVRHTAPPENKAPKVMPADWIAIMDQFDLGLTADLMKLVVMLGLFPGAMAVVDASGLKRSEIDLEEKTLFRTRAKNRGRAKVAPTHILLDDFPGYCLALKVWMGILPSDKDDLFGYQMTTGVGGMVDFDLPYKSPESRAGSLARAIRRKAHEIGNPDFSSHSGRASFKTFSDKADVREGYIRAQMQHKLRVDDGYARGIENRRGAFANVPEMQMVDSHAYELLRRHGFGGSVSYGRADGETLAESVMKNRDFSTPGLRKCVICGADMVHTGRGCRCGKDGCQPGKPYHRQARTCSDACRSALRRQNAS